MSGIASVKGKIVKEAIQRFPKFGNLTIAKSIMYNNGDVFDNNIDKIRTLVRYYRGSNGETGAAYRVDGKSTTPIAMPETWRIERVPYRLSAGLWLILADMHVPFHEPKPIESAIAYGQKNKVTGILLLGDFQDCASISFWPQTRRRDYEKEQAVCIDFLDFLRYEFPKAKMVYKKGNHEYRLPAIFYRNVPELAGTPLAATEEIMDLEGRGIEEVDHATIVMGGKLPIIHGHEIKISTSVNPARGLFLKTSTYGACGHFHQTSLHPGKNLFGDLLTTHSFGCLSDLHPSYNPWGNSWNWGTALLNVEKNGNFELENRRILPSGKIV